MSTKEPYIWAQVLFLKHNYSEYLLKWHAVPLEANARAFTKEPHISTKEPYISTKEPYIWALLKNKITLNI